MTIIKNIKGDVSEGEMTGIINSGTTINIGTSAFILHAQLSNQGVMIRRKDAIVFFPMDELVALAKSVNTKLVAPEPAKPANQ